ncbi:glycosyltransferase family 2 protein [Hyunsoonleella ulvae]|uniref:glycosyltransferase family 2 protein n=1 Tax=Hyunsoonleella ulvae TaxID=2799948 RepID=UPI001939E942|nr:glycosyltransferase family 2 protein [Hyunsoonleella ulvae]
MQISFLIVTKNRVKELEFTLEKLEAIIDKKIHEVLVFIDGCINTEKIIKDYDWIRWTVSKNSISASPSRQILYKKAKGNILVGLDDDAHPVSSNFINEIETTFKSNSNIGIIAFQEIRGVFETDADAMKLVEDKESYFTNDFVGCGFAILKQVYNKTRGFPVWIDIYGEEPALSLEVLDLGYAIFFQPNIIVNHRVNTNKRKEQGRNYFRFEHLLKNTIRLYLVYYPHPFFKVMKTLWHNFKKYAITNRYYFTSFCKVAFSTLHNLPEIFKYRRPVKRETITQRFNLKRLQYNTTTSNKSK